MGNEQRRRVLDLLAEGKVTAEEAERLIDALDRERTEPPSKTAPRSPSRPTHLRVVVNATDEGDGDGTSRINIRIPLQLLRAGVRIASLLPPPALAKVNAELSRSGVPIDLAQLKPQDLEELIDHLADLTVNIDDAEAEVHVFCE
ncbi:hypothetical protein [Streptomyces sp. NPDC049906]|uniref:SHOCT-like domain-containing protein n=1 Tax=Streptomyces sp. NPDC049906 TaxID=3155656 RepID=UPI0034317937